MTKTRRALVTVAVGFAAVLTFTSMTAIAAEVAPSAPGPGLATDADEGCIGWGKSPAERVTLATQAFEDAWNSRSLDAIATLVTPDVSYFAIRAGEFRTGRENMRADFATIFASLPAGTTMDVNVVNVTSLVPGLAHAAFRTTITYVNPDGTVAKVQKFVGANVWQLGCVPRAKTVRDYLAG